MNTYIPVHLGKDILHYNKLLKTKIFDESYIKIVWELT